MIYFKELAYAIVGAKGVQNLMKEVSRLETQEGVQVQSYSSRKSDTADPSGFSTRVSENIIVKVRVRIGFKMGPPTL